MDWKLYLLYNKCSKMTYIGITKNLKRRIQQHNGILSGGAKFTRAFKKDGLWEICGFIDKLTEHEARSFEVKSKKDKSKQKNENNLERRIRIIETITQQKMKIIICC